MEGFVPDETHSLAGTSRRIIARYLTREKQASFYRSIGIFSDSREDQPSSSMGRTKNSITLDNTMNEQSTPCNVLRADSDDGKPTGLVHLSQSMIDLPS